MRMKRLTFTIFIFLGVMVTKNSFSGPLSLDFGGLFHPYVFYAIPGTWDDLNEPDLLSLPERIVKLDLSARWNDIEGYAETAVEYRWSGFEYKGEFGETSLDLREAYFVWYPDFGEIRVGKQITAWGTVDGNNPTDNINPYNYYYLFNPGVERKSASCSVDALFYEKNSVFEILVLPFHSTSVIPFGEKDLPLAPPSAPPEEQIFEPSNEIEVGIKLRQSFSFGDISLSWFRGHDRNMSPIHKSLSPVEVIPFTGYTFYAEIPDRFGYRLTSIYGTDMVILLTPDISIRAENAVFHTSTKEIADCNLPLEVWYDQYAVEMEYEGITNLTMSIQFLGKDNFRILDESEPLEIDTLEQDEGEIVALWNNEEMFAPGMGMPFSGILDKGLFLSASYSCFDDRINISGNSLLDLESSGFMFGLIWGYSPVEDLEFDLGIVKFSGPSDNGESSSNPFSKLESFSHFVFGLKYDF